MDAATIESEALKLDIKARGRLARVLLESLHEGAVLSDAEVEALWAPELQRRVREFQEDPSIGSPGDEVFARVRARLR